MGIIYCEKDRTFTLQTKETTYQIKQKDRKQCQQIRGKRKVIVCSELSLEIQLCQRQCGSTRRSGHDNQWSHNIIPGSKCCQNCLCGMHRLLYSGYLTNIPMALEEAACVDGASTWNKEARS